jgi:hypothetical protein
MQWLKGKSLAAIGMAVIFVGGWQMWSVGQQPGADKAKSVATGNRLEFEVVHSFDGKYLGDTPGHMGRVGGLTGRKPRIALEDKVFRGDELVGLVTSLDWNRTNTSLDIEFDPVDHARICVGDSVWVVLDNTNPLKNPGPEVTK